jgi:hypothetical protein
MGHQIGVVQILFVFGRLLIVSQQRATGWAAQKTGWAAVHKSGQVLRLGAIRPMTQIAFYEVFRKVILTMDARIGRLRLQTFATTNRAQEDIVHPGSYAIAVPENAND